MGATSKTVREPAGATAQVQRSKPITVLGLKALTTADAGRTISFGESITGKVHVGRDGMVSVHATWRYRIGGKTREIRIGTWREAGGMTLKALRDERNRLATGLRSGIDPIEHKAAERLKAEADRVEALAELRRRTEAAREAELEQQRRLTVRQIFERWRSTQLQPNARADGKRTGRKDGGEYVRQQFERHVFPKIGDTSATELRKADLLALLDAQTSAGKMRTANVLLADLKQMLDFALDRELIASNPLATVRKRQIGGASVERERTLDENEVSMLAQALRDANMQPRSTIAVWLTLATGVRVGELMGAVWDDSLPGEPKPRKARLDVLQAQAETEGVKLGIVNLAARTWYLPDTKNQRSHTIHLSEFALAQFNALAGLRDVTPWVFPATDKSRPVCVKSFGKQLADRQREAEARFSNRTKATMSLSMPGGRWTAHDLRRTAATFMARLGFGSDTINEALNHMQADRMAKVYIQDRRQADQARAFDALGRRLSELFDGQVTSPRVIPMTPRAA